MDTLCDSDSYTLASSGGVRWELCFCMHRYAFAFGDTTTPADSPGVNALLNDAVSDNIAFVGTRYFALHNFPNNQYYLWFFQWTVSAPCRGAAEMINWICMPCQCRLWWQLLTCCLLHISQMQSSPR